MMSGRLRVLVSMVPIRSPMGRHAHLRAQRKEHDAHNDHGGAQQKAEQDAGGDGGNGKAEHQHNGHNGQHRL